MMIPCQLLRQSPANPDVTVIIDNRAKNIPALWHKDLHSQNDAITADQVDSKIAFFQDSLFLLLKFLFRQGTFVTQLLQPL